MSRAEDEVSGMVVKRSEKVDATKLSMDIYLSNPLWALDGIRSLGTIALEDGYELPNLLQRVNQLMEMGLVEKIEGHDNAGDSALAHELVRQLSDAIGPIANMLIEDVAEQLGYDLMALPVHGLDNFIQLLCKEISQKDKAELFVMNMKTFVKENYGSK